MGMDMASMGNGMPMMMGMGPMGFTRKLRVGNLPEDLDTEELVDLVSRVPAGPPQPVTVFFPRFCSLRSGLALLRLQIFQI